MAILLSAAGTTTVALPLLDLGFDLYPRRIRSLRVHPVQVKARSFLGPDGEFQASLSSLHADPNGYVVLPFVPPPDWQLHPRLWAIPIPEFLKLARPHDGGYLFARRVWSWAVACRRFPGRRVAPSESMASSGSPAS